MSILNFKVLLLTGPAGTGKTTTIQKIQTHLTENKIKWISSAPTGRAAQLVGGNTIHSLFGLVTNDVGNVIKCLLTNTQKEELGKVDVFFIDEISMFTNVLFDYISNQLKEITGVNEVFGGKKVILSGDILQLPPINRGMGRKYFFNAIDFDLKNVTVIYLNKIFRQEDESFIRFLNNIRIGLVDTAYLLESGVSVEKPDLERTMLFYTNKEVEEENIKKLNLNKNKTFSFLIQGKSGDARMLDKLIKDTIVPDVLQLKVGAKVVFIRNDLINGFANGNVGMIKNISISDQTITILNFSTNKIIDLKRSRFSNYNFFNPASFSQFPIVLGYAMTIHKSQGAGFDNLSVDFSKISNECHHIVYTALSRVRSKQGLHIKNFNSHYVQVDPEALKFDDLLKVNSQNLCDVLSFT